jgi:polar amino acid transport system substrate-binding protein
MTEATFANKKRYTLFVYARGESKNMCKRLFFLYGICYVQTALGQETVRITNGDWPPYLGERLPNYGIASDIVTRGFEAINMKVEYGFFPWARALTEVENGKWDAAAVWRKTPEREGKFYFSEPIIITAYVFYVSTEKNVKIKSYDDLKGLKIGTTRSYDYGKEFIKRQNEGKFISEEATSDELNFRKVLAGRIDAFPIEKTVGEALIKELIEPEKQKLLKKTEFEFEKSPLYLLFGKQDKYKTLVKKFNEGLKKIKK